MFVPASIPFLNYTPTLYHLTNENLVEKKYLLRYIFNNYIKGVLKMKNLLFKIIAGIALVVLYSCATSGSGEGSSIRDAVEQTANEIAAQLPERSRVAILSIQSVNDNLSEYIIDELSLSLFRRKIEVADRQNLEHVFNELNFQMSGNVSDESAMSVGRFIGAQYVVTGQLRDIGNVYSLMVNAISVEAANRASVSRFDVNKGVSFNRMLTGLGGRTRVEMPLDPESAGFHLDRGLLFLSRGDYDMAISEFTEAIKINPNFMAAYINRGYAYRDKRDINSALEDFNQAIRLDPNSSWAYRTRGEFYLWHIDKSDPDRAIADINIAINIDPKDQWNYSSRGAAYSMKGDHARALEDHNRAISMDPNVQWFYGHRGNTYKDMKDYLRALEDFNKALSIEPNSHWLLSERGSTYREMKNYTRSIEDLNKAISLEPNIHWYYASRGFNFMDMGEHDRAIEDFNKALSLNPNNYWVYAGRGNTYLAKRDYDRAIADFETAIQLGNNDQWVKDQLENAKRRGR
jgi:tetratricopeptide (TPR) repeat protein